MSPPARVDHALAHDSTRGVTVLFGGFGTSGLLADTWEYDGTNWSRRSTAVAPPARRRHAMAYDAFRGRVVLFGGLGINGTNSNDTWEWDGTRWTAINASAAPDSRSGHALAYDRWRGRVLLFGGQDFLRNAVYDDTWVWDGAAWTALPSSDRPLRRWGHAMASDGAAILLFGGRDRFGVLDDTWQLRNDGWHRNSPAERPPARADHVLVHDFERRRTVLFGGSTGGSAFLDDTWEWDSRGWRRPRVGTSPPALSGSDAVWDPANRRVALFGGDEWVTGPGGGRPAARADTWAYAPTVRHATTVVAGGCGTLQLSAPVPPLVGQPTYSLAVTGGPTPVFLYAIGVATAQLNPPLLFAGCPIHLQPPLLTTGGLASQPLWLVPLPIPDDPVLRGAAVFMQGFAGDPIRGGFESSAALRIVIGD